MTSARDTSRDKPFTVAQLREALAAFPDDALVLVDGYEGGYHDVSGAAEVRIVRNHHDGWYYGPHEEHPTYREPHDPDPRVHVVITGREK